MLKGAAANGRSKGVQSRFAEHPFLVVVGRSRGTARVFGVLRRNEQPLRRAVANLRSKRSPASGAPEVGRQSFSPRRLQAHEQ